MRGRVSTKEKCPICKKSFTTWKDFACPDHITRPKRFHVSIYIRGYGKQQIYYTPDGKALKDLRDAIDLWAEINRDLRRGTFDAKRYVKRAADEFSVSNLIDRFLKTKLKTIAPSYYTGFRTMCTRASGFFGSQYVRDVGKIHILNYKEHLEEIIQGKRLKDHLDHFRSFLRWCKSDLGLLESVPEFPHVDYADPLIHWLSPEDQIQIYSAFPEYAKPFFAFLFLHGCRPSEARALKCKDVDLAHREVRIHAAFSGEVYWPRRKGKKAKPLVLPIHPEIFGYIEERVKTNLPEAWLFPNPNTGDHYHVTAVRKLWERTRKRLNLSKEVRLYDATRHSVASQLVNSGTSLYTVSKILGHSTMKTTMRYAHQDTSRTRVHLEKLSLQRVTVVPFPNVANAAELGSKTGPKTEKPIKT
jgi:integrase